MKSVFIALLFVSSLAFSQIPDDTGITPSVQDHNEDIVGAIAQPTLKQKKHLKTPPKKSSKKNSVAAKKTKKAKKTSNGKKPKKNKKVNKKTY